MRFLEGVANLAWIWTAHRWVVSSRSQGFSWNRQRRKGSRARTKTGKASVVLWWEVMRIGVMENGRQRKMSKMKKIV